MAGMLSNVACDLKNRTLRISALGIHLNMLAYTSALICENCRLLRIAPLGFGKL